MRNANFMKNVFYEIVIDTVSLTQHVYTLTQLFLSFSFELANKRYN